MLTSTRTSWKTHTFMVGAKNKFKSYGFIDLQGLIPCTRPYYDWSSSARPMIVLTIISYWSPRWSWCTEANVPECDLAFWSDLAKAAGAWPYICLRGLSRIYQIAEAEKRQKRMRSSQRFCYISATLCWGEKWNTSISRSPTRKLRTCINKFKERQQTEEGGKTCK